MGIDGNRTSLGIAYLAASLIRAGLDPHVVDLARELRLHDPALDDALDKVSNPNPHGGLYGPRMPLVLQVIQPDAWSSPAALAVKVHASAVRAAARLAPRGHLFGLTVADSSVTYAFALGAALRRLGARVAMGGPTMSHRATAELALRAGAADAVVVGEGEAAMVALARAHAEQTWETALHAGPVAGLALLDDQSGVVRWSPNARNRALDTLPYPDWRGQRLPPDFAPLLAARGCVTKCSFCSEQTVSPKFAQRSVADVVGEMDRRHAELGVTTFEFADDLLNGNRRWLREVCEELVARGAPYRWQGMCRPHRMDAEVLRLMHLAGCRQLSYGVQHFSWRMLQIMGRREAPDPIRAVLDDTLSAGIECYIDIIVGHPGETAEDFEVTRAEVGALLARYPKLTINLNPYNYIYGASTDLRPGDFGVAVQRFSAPLPRQFEGLDDLAQQFVVAYEQLPGPATVLDRVNALASTAFTARRPAKIPILNEELPHCNDNCLHCGVADIMKTANVVPLASIVQSLRRLAPRSGGRVMFAVSELTIRPDFLAIMRAARAAGMGTVAVVTNGRMFAYPKFTRAAVKAGLTHALVSIYGPTPRTHQALSRTPHSFEQTVAGLQDLLRYQDDVTVMTNTVITKKNYRHLPHLVELLAGLGVRNVNLSFVQIIGNAARYRRAVVPRMSDVVGDLRAAVELGQALGLRMGIGGLPYCLLKGYEHLFGVDDLTYVENDDQIGDNITERSPYAQPAPCRECAMSAVCLGPQAEYSTIYGPGELRLYYGRRVLKRPPSELVRAMFPEFVEFEAARRPLGRPDPQAARAAAPRG